MDASLQQVDRKASVRISHCRSSFQGVDHRIQLIDQLLSFVLSVPELLLQFPLDVFLRMHLVHLPSVQASNFACLLLNIKQPNTLAGQGLRKQLARHSPQVNVSVLDPRRWLI
jgi:hypothetical protein